MLRPGAAALALVVALPAAAAERLSVDPAVDVPILAGAGVLYLLPDPPVSPPFDPGAPPGGLDALAPLRRHAAPATASDVTVYTVIGLGLLAAGLDGQADGDLPGRLVLQLEAMALAGGITSVVKAATTRPRPYTYGDHRVDSPGDQVSFFSNHTSATAAAAFAAARALDLTSDAGTLERIALYGGATLLTALVGSLRVAAGRHFPTDVIAGGLVGGAVGFLVPELHRAGPAVRAGAGLRGVSLAFTF